MNINYKDFKAVIFDMDGTIIDSMGVWTEIDRRCMEEHGIPFSPDFQKQINGMTMRETAEYVSATYHSKETPEEWMDIWNAMAMEAYGREVPLKPGVLEFLKALKAANIPMALATSNSRELVDAVFDHYGLQDFITHIVSSNDVKNGKPAPDVYLYAAKGLGVDPSDCLVFEDIIQGIMAAKNAGMKVVGVYDSHAFDTETELKDLTDAYIRDYRELLV